MPILKYKEIRQINDSTMFHESIDWSDRFARKIEERTLLRIQEWLEDRGDFEIAVELGRKFIKEKNANS